MTELTFSWLATSQFACVKYKRLVSTTDMILNFLFAFCWKSLVIVCSINKLNLFRLTQFPNSFPSLSCCIQNTLYKNIKLYLSNRTCCWDSTDQYFSSSFAPTLMKKLSHWEFLTSGRWPLDPYTFCWVGFPSDAWASHPPSLHTNQTTGRAVWLSVVPGFKSAREERLWSKISLLSFHHCQLHLLLDCICSTEDMLLFETKANAIPRGSSCVLLDYHL